MVDKAALLKKIRALAERGVGGEADNAEEILRRLMEKYGVSEDELDEEERRRHDFEYHGKEQEKLLRQVVYKVTGDYAYNLVYRASGRRVKTQLGADCTAAEKVEIEFLFDFYTRLWERERAAFLSAFIQKQMDSVLGKKGTKARLLVLSERVTRSEIIIKVQDGRAITVVRAIDRLERELGDLFPVIFKSITCDNGSEFANWAGIERSVWKRKGQRTTVYFCHPYTACERGTNENINRMIRRHFPKGTDFGKVTAAEVKRVERWINTYPREILGFSSSADMFAEAFGRAS